jgi:hypothetical protein
MRDYTGIDSLLSPLFCLVVMVSVWALERCMPGRDILFFIPKSWRDTQPIYQLADEQALKETADMMMPDVDNKDPAAPPSGFGVDGSLVDDVVGLKKAGNAAAGKRPTLADDSAHGGRQMAAGKAPL